MNNTLPPKLSSKTLKDATFFMLSDGRSYLEQSYDEITFADDVNGWSCVFESFSKQEVLGAHTDFFLTAANIDALSKHLLNIVESFETS